MRSAIDRIVSAMFADLAPSNPSISYTPALPDISPTNFMPKFGKLLLDFSTNWLRKKTVISSALAFPSALTAIFALSFRYLIMIWRSITGACCTTWGG